MFKSLKKFYKNNRIYCILMIISVLCILSLGIGVIVYFVNQNTSSPYGDRLVDIDEHSLGNTLKDLESFYKAQEGVLSAKVRLQGRIIYVTVDTPDETSIEQIQNIATSSLEKIPQEQQEYYDVQFIMTRKSYPALMGSKTTSSVTITWANYALDTEEQTTTTAKK